MLVIDASVAAGWFVPDPGAEGQPTVPDEPLIAPDLIVAELSNTFWKIARGGGLKPDQVGRMVAAIPEYFMRLEPAANIAARAIQLAFELDHPAYDCFYLSLAEREGATVVTADKRLLRRLSGTRYEALAHPPTQA